MAYEMGEIFKWHLNYATKDPSQGCQLCALGSKLVLFITGECHSNCFYCPVSEERRMDVIFANEQLITSPSEAIAEAKMISALGMGITGGDPGLKINRVTEYLKAFKKEFGKEFHCHLYTSLPLTEKQLETLFDAGLDEIRFHPPNLKLTKKMQETIIYANTLSWEVGFEVPVIPEQKEDLIKIIEFAYKNNLKFVNLNEFEVTEANYKRLTKKGYHVKDETSVGVIGSEELALELLNKYKDRNLILHFCTAKYKDRVQLKNRLIRRAKNFAKAFDEITEEGLIIRGRIKFIDTSFVERFAGYLKEDYEVEDNFIELHKKAGYLFTAWYIVEELADELAERFSGKIESIEIIHQYPYEEGIIVYVEPLFEI